MPALADDLDEPAGAGARASASACSRTAISRTRPTSGTVGRSTLREPTSSPTSTARTACDLPLTWNGASSVVRKTVCERCHHLHSRQQLSRPGLAP